MAPPTAAAEVMTDLPHSEGTFFMGVGGGGSRDNLAPMTCDSVMSQRHCSFAVVALGVLRLLTREPLAALLCVRWAWLHLKPVPVTCVTPAVQCWNGMFKLTSVTGGFAEGLNRNVSNGCPCLFA